VIDADDAVRRYLSGETIQQIARIYQTRARNVSDVLKASGVAVRDVGLTPLPAEDVVARYVAGESEKALAAAYGVQRGTIRRYLLNAAVQPRGRSESMFVRMANTSPDERKRNALAAHNAVRGRSRSIEERCKGALTRQMRASHVSPYETALRSYLADLGIECIPQQAVGPYNLDLGAEPVAVEVFGGGWHAYGSHAVRAPKRLNYLFDAGWNVIVVAVDPNRAPLTDGAAHEVAAFIEQSRRDPSFRRQYRVIRGNGQSSAAFGLDLDCAA